MSVQENYGRISAHDLVASLTPWREVSPLVGRIVIAGPIFALSTLAFFGKTHISLTFLFALILSASLSFCVFQVASGEGIAWRIQKRLKVNNQFPRGKRVLPMLSPSPMTEIRTSSWLLVESNYQQLSRAWRTETGARTGGPPARFGLLLAFLPINGGQTTLAFHDGTHELAYSQNRIFVHDYSLPIPSTTGQRSKLWHEAAEMFDQLLSKLYQHQAQAWSVDSLLNGSRYGENPESLRLAIRAVQKWRLAQARPGNKLQITPTGIRWVEASDKFQTERVTSGGRRGGRSSTVNFNIGDFRGNLTNIQGNNTGNINSTYSKVVESPGLLLAALADLLASNQIPWQEPEFQTIHRDFSRAIEEDELDEGIVRQAFEKLKYLVGQLALGIGGNGAYDLLLHHFR